MIFKSSNQIIQYPDKRPVRCVNATSVPLMSNLDVELDLNVILPRAVMRGIISVLIITHYALPSVGCAPLYEHLALRPLFCVGPLRVHRSGGEWCCAATVTHRLCIRTHIHTMLTARAVYVVRYPTLSRMD